MLELLLIAAWAAVVLVLAGWVPYALLTGRMYQLLPSFRGAGRSGMGGFGGQVPHADASGFVAIAHVAYGMAQWLLILGAIYIALRLFV